MWLAEDAGSWSFIWADRMESGSACFGERDDVERFVREELDENLHALSRLDNRRSDLLHERESHRLRFRGKEGEVNVCAMPSYRGKTGVAQGEESSGSHVAGSKYQ